eukprot:ctg_342.g237
MESNKRLSRHEQAVMVQLLRAHGLRVDGRAAATERHMTLETEVIPSAAGSARVRLPGSTEVLAGTSTELQSHVSEGAQTTIPEGCLTFRVEFCGAADRLYQGRGAEAPSAEMTSLLRPRPTAHPVLLLEPVRGCAGAGHGRRQRGRCGDGGGACRPGHHLLAGGGMERGCRPWGHGRLGAGRRLGAIPAGRCDQRAAQYHPGVDGRGQRHGRWGDRRVDLARSGRRSQCGGGEQRCSGAHRGIRRFAPSLWGAPTRRPVAATGDGEKSRRAGHHAVRRTVCVAGRFHRRKHRRRRSRRIDAVESSTDADSARGKRKCQAHASRHHRQPMSHHVITPTPLFFAFRHVTPQPVLQHRAPLVDRQRVQRRLRLSQRCRGMRQRGGGGHRQIQRLHKAHHGNGEEEVSGVVHGATDAAALVAKHKRYAAQCWGGPIELVQRHGGAALQ